MIKYYTLISIGQVFCYFYLNTKYCDVTRILFCLFVFITVELYAQVLFKGKGNVSFVSDAPLELIQGNTDDLAGLLDTSNMNFAFKVDISTFEGFNSPLQKEHFNEHYMETKKYPSATFVGTILSEEDCSNGCETTATCKGKFTIHGVTQIVAIPVSFKFDDNVIKINGGFDIQLSDYNIKIPKIVQAKIANEISIKVDLVMSNDL